MLLKGGLCGAAPAPWCSVTPRRLTHRQRHTFARAYESQIKRLIDAGRSVEEIGKQLGMRPEEIFRLSEFSKEDFLEMMIHKDVPYSSAEVLTIV